VMTMCIWHRLL